MDVILSFQRKHTKVGFFSQLASSNYLMEDSILISYVDCLQIWPLDAKILTFVKFSLKFSAKYVR